MMSDRHIVIEQHQILQTLKSIENSIMNDIEEHRIQTSLNAQIHNDCFEYNKQFSSVFYQMTK